jgi:predicted nucleic acid-binding Zn finger protein
MQQLTIEHKKSTSNQKIVSNENKSEELDNKREGHGLNIALTLNVYRLLTSDVYYVQSERSNDIYYYVKYNPSVFEWCSCPDNSTRRIKCKHQFAIEYAIIKGTLKDIDKLPAEAKRYPATTTVEAIAAKSYQDDDYDF